MMKLFPQKPSHILIHHSAVNDNPRKCDLEAYRLFHTSYVFDGEIVTEQEYYDKLETIEIGRNVYHRKPWDDIGYHFVIERREVQMQVVLPVPLGISYIPTMIPTTLDVIQLVMGRGRDTKYTGVHARGTINGNFANDVALGVCIAGNFDAYSPNNELWDFAAIKVASLCEEYNIPSLNIIGHRDVQDNKSCPGNNFNMIAFRETVEAYLV